MNSKALKTLLFTIIIAITICFSGCSGENEKSQEIQGVRFYDTDKIIITFRVPDGMSVNEVIGSDIGIENTMSILSIDQSGNTSTSFVYWYKVVNGGLLTRHDDVFCYGPYSSLVSNSSGSKVPTTMVMRKTPSEDNIFNPEDAEKLEEKYGISLNFGS